MKKQKCDICGELEQFVFMIIKDENGCAKYLHLCENCFRKHEKPFKE